MAYIGNDPQNQGFTPAIDYFNGDGVTVTFTLSRPIASVAQLIVAIDNVIQNPSTAFSVSGNSITFTSAPLSGTNNIWVEYTSLITTYAAISQDPSVIGDISATGGYLAEGDFGNTFIDGTIVDYVTGTARVTTSAGDAITFYNGGTNARNPLMTLAATGNVGVGTSSPAQKLNVSGSGSVYSAITNTGTGPSNLLLGAANAQTQIISRDATTGAVPTVFLQGTAESMRINSSGNVLVGNTGLLSGMGGTFAVGNDRQVSIDGDTGGAIYMRGSAGGWAIGKYFVGNAGAFLGGFGALGGANALTYYWVGTAFNGTGVYLNYGGNSWIALSDERDKNIHGVIENALDKVSQFNGIYYNYKNDAEGTKQRVGFSAQKVKAVFPEAVSEIQREVDNPSEETKRLALSTTDIVPLLVQAIQELKATVDAQAARIAALEAK
jgi:hypothetical protein